MFAGFDGWLRIDDDKPYSVSEFIERANVALDRDLGEITIEGEVGSFKVNQRKWVFFDLKENDASVSCFLPLSRLTVGLKDGMKVEVLVTPKVTHWGKLSLTVERIIPRGEGNIKKSFEILKKKLASEGLFDPARKRLLPDDIRKIGVISSTSAAGYADFLKILDNRWGGLKVVTVNTQVQGVQAPAQIVQALNFLNQQAEVDVIAILRGGGSADDLAAFNDEGLARAIAVSKIPVITGIGHEVDESLADLVADVRASTPSNAAERLTRDRRALSQQMATRFYEAKRHLFSEIAKAEADNQAKLQNAREAILQKIDRAVEHVADAQKLLESLNPERVLERGYALLLAGGNTISPGQDLDFITKDYLVKTRVKSVRERNGPCSSKLAVTRVKSDKVNKVL